LALGKTDLYVVVAVSCVVLVTIALAVAIMCYRKLTADNTSIEQQKDAGK